MSHQSEGTSMKTLVILETWCLENC